MHIELTAKEKSELEVRHKHERDRRIADRIKAVLLYSEKWTQVQIAQALRIRPETVQQHLKDYLDAEKLKPENGGSEGLLTKEKTDELIEHLEKITYTKVCDICEYVKEKYNVKFTVSGMTQWLHRTKFSYKKPKGVPAKADAKAQAEFVKYYKRLLKKTPKNEPIEFGDGVHPTMATKVSYGWIRKGSNKLIATNASRTRLNFFGSINLKTMKIASKEHETINSCAIEAHFSLLRKKYPKALKIHLIVDRSPYNTSNATKQAAKKYRIVLHHLPAHSPNLNPIERVWKVMNECVRNNQFFSSAPIFKRKINDFFTIIWPNIAHSMRGRINDNFQTLKQASST